MVDNLNLAFIEQMPEIWNMFIQKWANCDFSEDNFNYFLHYLLILKLIHIICFGVHG